MLMCMMKYFSLSRSQCVWRDRKCVTIEIGKSCWENLEKRAPNYLEGDQRKIHPGGNSCVNPWGMRRWEPGRKGWWARLAEELFMHM